MKNFLRSQMKLLKPALSSTSASLESIRKRHDTLGRFMARSYRDEVITLKADADQYEGVVLVPKKEIFDGIILYIHGGGYIAGNLNYAKGFGTVLCAKLGIRVFCLAYRLAPENLFPAALDDALAAYESLLDSGYLPSKIVLCGESAGGGLCYSLCQTLRDRGMPIPAGIISISPWTDLTSSGLSYVTNDKIDPSMSTEKLKYFSDLYVYGASYTEEKNMEVINEPDPEKDRRTKSDYRMSPLFGSLERMPPSLIFVGGDEVMLDDARSLHAFLIENECDSELVIREGMWHAYVLYNLKENASDFDSIAKFLKKTVASKKNPRWLLLDNAAKIFPASRRRNWNNIYRVSATLNEKVDREVLQNALRITVKRFPSIAVRIKTGFFWYYLEEIPKSPEILDEKPYPLSGMPFSDMKKCAFRVFVYENRMAVEIYHALTDANGAIVFLKTLLAEYASQKKGMAVECIDGVLDRMEAPSAAELEDSFLKYAGRKKATDQKVDAYKITGKSEPDGFKTNTTFILDAEEVRARARSLGVTVTAYMAAVLTVATIRIQNREIHDQRRAKPIRIHIPVNLRGIFPSSTLRNFFMFVRSHIDPSLGEYEFEEICRIIHAQMKLGITEKNMAAMIESNVGIERKLILRAFPLFMKNIVMRIIFLAVGERKSSYTLSNLGVITLPDGLSEMVDRMDFVLGVQASAPYNTAMLTYKGKLYLNVIRDIREPLLEREIYTVFRELSLENTVESNTRGGN